MHHPTFFNLSLFLFTLSFNLKLPSRWSIPHFCIFKSICACRCAASFYPSTFSSSPCLDPLPQTSHYLFFLSLSSTVLLHPSVVCSCSPDWCEQTASISVLYIIQIRYACACISESPRQSLTRCADRGYAKTHTHIFFVYLYAQTLPFRYPSLPTTTPHKHTYTHARQLSKDYFSKLWQTRQNTVCSYVRKNVNVCMWQHAHLLETETECAFKWVC